MAKRITINYEKKPCYDIVFTEDFELLTDELAVFDIEEKKLAVICDTNTERLFADAVVSKLTGHCKK